MNLFGSLKLASLLACCFLSNLVIASTLETPAVGSLPYHMMDGVKMFHLVAEPVEVEFCDKTPCKRVVTWGYNGSSPGPTIEAVEGDVVRIVFTNNLPMPTAVHWHGLELPNAMDGGGMHTQKLVQPGETFTYEFTLEQTGTFMYHSGHMQALQAGMGQGGFFIAHPKAHEDPAPVDKDYAFMLQIWSIPPYDSLPDTMSMNFNWFTMNGKAAPAIPHMTAKPGERIRVRLANLSMMSHPIHLHGHTFWIVETGAGRNPKSTHIKTNTVSVNAGETMTIEFEASKWPGPWLFHCHFLHHITNDMDRPPIPGEAMMPMGEAGMFTILDVENQEAEMTYGEEL